MRRRISLLPILGAYTLISVGINPAKLDERDYLTFATHLTHGFYAHAHARRAVFFLWHGPGLPAFLAPLVALHVPLGLMRFLAGPVLLFAALVVFNYLAEMYVSERTAWIATYALALYLPFFTVLGTIYVEPLATLCLTLAVFFMVRSYRGGTSDHLYAGVALAALALSRVEYGYVILGALLLSGAWLLAVRDSVAARRSTIAAGVALLLCVPWLGYTYSLTNRPFYWGNSGGLSLFWMTVPRTLGDWHKDSEVYTIPQLKPERKLFTSLPSMKPLAQDEKLQHVAFRNIRADPAHYLANVGNNVGRLLFNVPYSFSEGQSPLSFRGGKKGALLFALPNAILLGLLGAAVVLRFRTRRRLGPEIMPIAVLTALGFAVHVPFAAYARFLIPLAPAAAWVALATIATCLSASRTTPEHDSSS